MVIQSSLNLETTRIEPFCHSCLSSVRVAREFPQARVSIQLRMIYSPLTVVFTIRHVLRGTITTFCMILSNRDRRRLHGFQRVRQSLLDGRGVNVEMVLLFVLLKLFISLQRERKIRARA